MPCRGKGHRAAPGSAAAWRALCRSHAAPSSPAPPVHTHPCMHAKGGVCWGVCAGCRHVLRHMTSKFQSTAARPVHAHACTCGPRMCHWCHVMRAPSSGVGARAPYLLVQVLQLVLGQLELRDLREHNVPAPMVDVSHHVVHAVDRVQGDRAFVLRAPPTGVGYAPACRATREGNVPLSHTRACVLQDAQRTWIALKDSVKPFSLQNWRMILTTLQQEARWQGSRGSCSGSSVLWAMQDSTHSVASISRDIFSYAVAVMPVIIN